MRSPSLTVIAFTTLTRDERRSGGSERDSRGQETIYEIDKEARYQKKGTLGGGGKNWKDEREVNDVFSLCGFMLWL